MTIERANDTDDDEKCTKHIDDDTITKLFKIRTFDEAHTRRGTKNN